MGMRGNSTRQRRLSCSSFVLIFSQLSSRRIGGEETYGELHLYNVSGTIALYSAHSTRQTFFPDSLSQTQRWHHDRWFCADSPHSKALSSIQMPARLACARPTVHKLMTSRPTAVIWHIVHIRRLLSTVGPPLEISHLSFYGWYVL